MNAARTWRAAALFITATTLAGQALAQESAPATQPDDTAQSPASAGLPPVASKEDVSYSIGFTIGTDMVQRSSDLDVDQLIDGIKAGLGHSESRLSPDEIDRCLFDFQKQMQRQQFLRAQDNLDEGLAYLKQNAEQEGVNVTETGLQYKVIESGDGLTPTVQDIVTARYRGTLIDGTEFDSSPGDEPVAFPVGRVIPGWVEALQMMKVGDKWELTIPADLAYGEAGDQRGIIGPNQVLLFEIELVEIK